MVFGVQFYRWAGFTLVFLAWGVFAAVLGKGLNAPTAIQTNKAPTTRKPSTVLIRFHLGAGKCTEHTVYYNVDLGRYYVLDSEQRIVMLLGPSGKVDGFRDTWMPWSNTPKDLIELWKQGNNND